MHKFDKHEKKTILLFQLTVQKKRKKNKIPNEIKTIAPKTNKIKRKTSFYYK
jgi:hypothetical protein